MRLLLGLGHAESERGRALTIGNFDGVHRGHQAMLALLRSEARQRGLPSCVLTFEPHPRDHFARRAGRPLSAPLRVSALRDKLAELSRCGVDECVVLRFGESLARQAPRTFASDVLARGLRARYVLVGDDFRYGAARAGDYAMLDAAGLEFGFDVARMRSYEVHGMRVSSSDVRQALQDGDMARAATLLGRPFSISGRVIRGRRLGRELGFRTLNLRCASGRAAASGIFVARVLGLGDAPLAGVASLGVRPTVESDGRAMLETHCFDWPVGWEADAGYGRCIGVELLKKLHDERRYDSIEALRVGIAADADEARQWFAHHRVESLAG